jgi:hypothetical protein
MFTGTPRRAGALKKGGTPASLRTINNQIMKETVSFISASAIMALTAPDENGGALLREVSTMLDASEGIDLTQYFTDGTPNRNGINAMIQAFAHGLAVTIKHAERKGLYKEGELMKRAISHIDAAYNANSRDISNGSPDSGENN